MVLKVSNLIGKQEAIRHEFVINWEEPLKSTNYDAEYILLGEVVHEGIPVEYALPHFDDIEIVVSQSHAVPEQTSITWLVCFSIPVLANDVLNGVKFTSAVIGVDHNLLPSKDLLLASVHQVVLMHAVFLSLVVCCLLSMLILLP